MNTDLITTVNAIIIQEGKLLIVKDDLKYVLPGGRMEGHEVDLETLKREIKEELAIEINSNDATLLGYFDFDKAFKSDRPLQMRVYIVNTTQKPIINDDEISELVWLDAKLYSQMLDLPKPWFDKIFLKLKGLGLIDLF